MELYKKIIRKRSTRLAILRCLSFIPDSVMIRFQYRVKTGRRLNLKNPLRYTEKLQWYKINYRTKLMVQAVDKWDVRVFLANLGLEDILVKSYGVYDRPEDINFNDLPKQFVLKDTLGGGGNSVIIVNDKSKMDYNDILERLNQWVSSNNHTKSGGREWAYYSGKKHRIIIEELLPSNPEEGGLIDYKFLCFNGNPEVLYILADRDMGDSAGCGIYDLAFNLLPYQELDEKPLQRTIEKPQNYDQMVVYANMISRYFPEARIDLYNVEGKIYFGEITFFDSSGYMLFDPDSFDYELGAKWTLPERCIEI